ncbi:MAG: guanylate kinase [Sporomusaceae bacterium]|nr:guanylate kinase [Sporomusaceae bacterium]
MGKIYCLIGKSSSGKDTIFKALAEDKDLNLKPVVSYTTRPIRQNEHHGTEYYFITEEQLREYKEAGSIIEQRDYETINGIWSYCTVDDGQIDITRSTSYLLILTLEAYKSLRRYFGSQYVVPLYIAVDDGIRLERALKREQAQQNPNYDELCRRFLADSSDFEITKLQDYGITKHYCNENLSACIHTIKTAIIAAKESM